MNLNNSSGQNNRRNQQIGAYNSAFAQNKAVEDKYIHIADQEGAGTQPTSPPVYASFQPT